MVEWPEQVCQTNRMAAKPVKSPRMQNALSGWWHGIGSYHHSQSFCLPLPNLLEKSHKEDGPPHLSWLLYLLLASHIFWQLPTWAGYLFFWFCSYVQHSSLSIIQLSYLVKQSHFNMSRSVKAIVQLSNNMINHAKFLMMMHVCEEQLSLFLVLLQLAHRNYIICSTNYFPKNLWPLIGKCFISIFKCTLQNSENLVTFFHTDWTILCHRVNVMSDNQLGHQEQSQFFGS